MIRTPPVRDSWNSPLPADPSAMGKRCHSRREAHASDEWEMDYPSHFISALVEEQSGWQTGEPLPLESVAYTDRQISSLRKRYEFRNDATVEDYLEENPSLRNLLIEAHNKIREYFGSDTPVALDVLREPDAKNGGRLFVLILTTLRPKEALSRLDELDRGWWLGALSQARGKVTIDIDYG